MINNIVNNRDIIRITGTKFLFVYSFTFIYCNRMPDDDRKSRNMCRQG